MKKTTERENLYLKRSMNLLGRVAVVIVSVIFFPRIISKVANKIYKNKIF